MTGDRRHHGHHPGWFVAVVSVVGLLVGGCSSGSSTRTAGGAEPGPTNPTTVVSLTFDDVSASQRAVRPILGAHGMRGTFFVSSGLVGTSSYYMSWDDVHELARDGNEIGGHTLTHADLNTVDDAEQRRQVCDDRDALVRLGFNVSVFAYPYSAPNPAAEGVVRDCGYRSARSVGGVACGPACATAESIPPLDPYRMRTTPGIRGDTRLADMKRWVTAAEAGGGGWVPFVFHNICEGCTVNSITQADFAAFLDWLKPRTANGTVVKTIGEALSGYFSVRPELPKRP
jgi:peptidoglycan/xylan/chitin deacetylase (PgdA/CDA1 family)